MQIDIPENLKLDGRVYKTADFDAHTMQVYLEYRFCKYKVENLQKYIDVLKGAQTLVKSELKSEILSKKAGFL